MGWQAVTIKKRPMEGPVAQLLPEEAALQEKAALKAVKDTLQLTPPPHHITYCLDSFRHTDPLSGSTSTYFITQYGLWLLYASHCHVQMTGIFSWWLELVL